jgi:hypothetical protein
MSEKKTFKYIISAECIYFEEFFEDLIKTFVEFSDHDTVIFISYRIRMQSKIDYFIELLEEYFDYKYIDQNELN